VMTPRSYCPGEESYSSPGAQTFRFSGVSLYLKTRLSVLSQPDLFSGVGCMASPIAAIDDWHQWSPWHHQTGTLLHRH